MPLSIIIFLLSCFFSFEANSQNNTNSLSIFDKDKVLSIISVNYFYNKKLLSKDSKIKCQLNFYDDYKKKAISKIDENSNYVILISNPGKVFLESIKCSRHSIPLIYGASRFKRIEDMGFTAHDGFVNYVGEINLNFTPSIFKILDIFNLSNFLNDSNGDLEIKVNDNIFDVLNYINLRFNDIYHLKLTKSLLKDSHSLNPNETPEIYSQENQQKNEIIQAINNNQYQQKNITNNAENKIEEINIENSTESVKEKDLHEKFDNNTNLEDNNYKHPYLAPRYSDFYSPVYNPYYLIGSPSSYYLMHTLVVQDPVIESPH